MQTSNFSRIKFAIALLGMLLTYFPTAFCVQNNTNKKYKLATAIADEYVRSFSSQTEEQEEQEAELKKDIPAHEARPAKLDGVALRKAIFNNILAKSEKLFEVQQQMEPILNPYAWSDLKLFYGSTTQPGYNLMSRINRTTTTLGEAALATLLVTPTSNLAVLQERQDILKTLLNNPSQIEGLKKNLEIYHDAEQSMVSFWTFTDPLYSKEYREYMDDRFYAKGEDPSNTSVGWLEFKKRFFRDFWSIQLGIIYPIIVPLTAETFFREDFSIIKGLRKFLWKKAIPYYGGWFVWRKSTKHDRELGQEPRAFHLLQPILSEVLYTYSVYNSVKNYLEYSGVLGHLALRMADVQAFIIATSQVSTLIANTPELEKIYGKNITAVRELLAQPDNTELGTLVAYLKNLPLSDWSYFFNNAGKLLAAHKLFIAHRKAFSDAMYEVGLLDAYLSFTTLLQEATTYHSEHAYVFAEFLDRQQKTKPYIKMDDMWNIFLDAKQAVGNSIEMDGTPGGTSNIILTGPNAGGKSTFLTGVTNALLLAHVMGIGPANKIVITPFNRINTYIDIVDDIAAGKSLFMAEVDRAQKHIRILEKLQRDEFSFTIFDEPFSGTNPIEGAAAEYSILEATADYKNSLTMVATHYPTVMLLEAKAPGKGFANYKVYITRKDGSRKINYTYKIVPGKSTQAIAIDILEEQGYDIKMLERAREIIEHPERYQANF